MAYAKQKLKVLKELGSDKPVSQGRLKPREGFPDCRHDLLYDLTVHLVVNFREGKRGQLVDLPVEYRHTIVLNKSLLKALEVMDYS